MQTYRIGDRTVHIGTSAERTALTAANYSGQYFLETDTGNEYVCAGSTWHPTVSAGAAHAAALEALRQSDGTVTLIPSSSGNTRTAVVKAGGAAVVPDTDLSAITATDIIKWTFAAGYKRFAAMASETAVAGHNIHGWWITWNAGSATAAKDRLREALDTAAGIEIAVYVAAATVHADENKAGIILPVGCMLGFSSLDDITDVYVMPVAEAAVAVGGSVLTVSLS